MFDLRDAADPDHGQPVLTTADDRAVHHARLQDAAQVPDRLWAADIIDVSTWSDWVYVALVTDAYARRILGWRVATTQLVLDALEQAIWTRQRSVEHVVAHSDRGSQNTSIRYSERLAEVGIAASVGSVGDSYDDALAEAVNSLYKAEVIHHRGPPADLEDAFYAHHRAQQPAGLTV